MTKRKYSTQIVSDKIYHLADDADFFDDTSHDIHIQTWDAEGGTDIHSDILILDMDLRDREKNTGLLNQGLFDITGEWTGVEEPLKKLPAEIPRYLNNGSVVIILLAGIVEPPGVGRPTNYDWFYDLSIGETINYTHGRSLIEMVTEVTPFQKYMSYVDQYVHGIRLNEEVIGAPEILARHAVDNETLAVALDEYLDPHGVHREIPGNLILLPQPTVLPDSLPDVIDALVCLGQHYRTRHEVEETLGNEGSVDIEAVLNKEENEIIDYKRQFPESAHNLEKDLVAFANTQGGVVVIGVSDDRNIIGVEDTDNVMNRVAGVIRNNISPALNVDMETHEIDDEQVVSVRVDRREATTPMYSTNQDKVYGRFGPASESLSGPEIDKHFS